jgi:glycosyltransferase involved in cell wall biosynthesis
VRIGFISPLPPQPTGVADYSAGLLSELRRRAQVKVAESPQPGCDAWIYQVGNNPLHLAAYRAALAEPGVTVLHDAVLHHLLLGILSEEQYVEEFVYNYGAWMRDLARELWAARSRSGADARYFDYPLLRRIVERSRVVVVHNPAARRAVRTAVPEAEVVEIPHYFVPPRLPNAWRETRDRLGIATNEVVVGVFGYLRESKRIGSALRALDAVRRGRLLLAGCFVSNELERALEPQLRDPRVVRVGHAPGAEWWRLAEITDICVNLRHPAAGETSGIGIRMMGIGKPVVVTDSEENAGLPEMSVIRVDPGEAEVEMLACYLRALGESEEMRREIGRRAAEHIRTHHTLEGTAEAYLSTCRRCASNRL